LAQDGTYPELEEEEAVFFKETVEVFDFEMLVFGENILDLYKNRHDKFKYK